MTPRVVKAEHRGGHRVLIVFDDGTAGEVDLSAELWGPVFEPLREDPRAFAALRVDPELGTIMWPNGADLAPEHLYALLRPGRGVAGGTATR